MLSSQAWGAGQGKPLGKRFLSDVYTTLEKLQTSKGQGIYIRLLPKETRPINPYTLGRVLQTMNKVICSERPELSSGTKNPGFVKAKADRYTSSLG